MLSFTATNAINNSSIELVAELNENNTWTIKTTIDYVDYFINNFVFHHQINTLKSVSKMFKLCQDEIIYKHSNELIEISIVVDFLDDEIITFELVKLNQNYEEILMKKVSSLENRILILEEENKILKNNTYIPKSTQGTFWVFFDEEEGKLDYKMICRDSERQEEFEEKMLEAFKSVNIEYLNSFISSFKSYLSESSLEKIKKTMKKIKRLTNLNDLWDIMSNIRIVPKTQTKWNTGNSVVIDVPEFNLFFQVPNHTTCGFFITNGNINTGGYMCRTGNNYVKYGNYYGSITGGCGGVIKNTFICNYIKFSFTKFENPEEIMKLDESILGNIKYTCVVQNSVYDIFGEIDKEMKNTYIYDI